MSKTWFVTGAARGIGAAIVKAALAAGQNVVATGRDPAKVAAAFAPPPDKLFVAALDVAVAGQAESAVAATIARFGGIDVLVNNAGYGQLGAFEQQGPADAERQFATNVFGVFNVTRAILPIMRKQRGGRIFNITPIGGLRGGPGASLYAASKFAVEGFSESLALEIAEFGIALTLVEPGFFRTDFLDPSSIRYGDNRIVDYDAFTAKGSGTITTRAAISRRAIPPSSPPSLSISPDAKSRRCALSPVRTRWRCSRPKSPTSGPNSRRGARFR